MKRKFWIFDLDDTLIPSTEAYTEALRALGNFYSYDLFQSARRDVKAALGAQPAARNRWLYFKRMLELRDEYSPERLKIVAGKYEDALYRQLARRWDELGRAEFCARARERAHLSILTNETTRTQILKLSACDPSGTFFPTVVTSEEIGREKPAVQIFQALLQRLGNPDPREVVMIGDDVQKDLVPALQLGWKAVLTTEFVAAPNDLPAGISTISRLDDLFDVVGAE